MRPSYIIISLVAVLTTTAPPVRAQQHTRDSIPSLVQSIDNATRWQLRRYWTPPETAGPTQMPSVEAYLWIMNGWIGVLRNPPRLLGQFKLRLLLADHSQNRAILIDLEGKLPQQDDNPHIIITTREYKPDNQTWMVSTPSDTLAFLARSYAGALATEEHETTNPGLSDLLLLLFPNPIGYRVWEREDPQMPDNHYRLILGGERVRDGAETKRWVILIQSNEHEINNLIYRLSMIERWRALKIYLSAFNDRGEEIADRPPQNLITNYSPISVMESLMRALPGPTPFDLLRSVERDWKDRTKE